LNHRGLAGFAVTLLVTNGALAQSVADEPDEETTSLYWDQGEFRPFVSAALALGAVSSLEVAGGYGQPFWIWAGVEGTALTTFDFGMLSIGPRVSLVVVDLSLKRRIDQTYSHGYLPQQDSYSGSFVEDDHGPNIDYGAWDASLNGLFPTPGGFGVYELAATRVDDIPDNRDLFEEWHRVVMRERWVYAVRLGWSALAFRERLAAGALGEFLTTEDRGNTWRVGPMLDYRFTEHLSATLVYTVPVASPDSLGPWTGSWGTLRLRYALATGEPRPAFP
jgi:hypothetical protein